MAAIHPVYLRRRKVGASATTYSYDAENRLTSVSGAATAAFVYDGRACPERSRRGNRVKATFGATTTVYPSTVLRAGVGNIYERDNGSTVRKYYYAGGVRVAMRTGGQTYYLLGDHLGGTNVTYNSSNGQITKLLYKPWGETRFSTGTTPTTWRFTGQREDATIGLYYFNARYLDPQLGRFTQPDTIVPEPGDPQSLNRYSYVLNSPLRYTDPTGMFSEDEIMQYLGVNTWDDVLAMFGEGGVMAGAWGFLEVLRQAELGDNISMWMDALNRTQALPFLVGAFYEQDGQLMFGGAMQIGGNTWQATMGVVAFASLSGNGSPTRFWVQGATTNAYVYNTKYGHLKFDASRVDWVGVGLDGLGIVTDVKTVGAGGRPVKGSTAPKRAHEPCLDKA